jgi:hypothetical protein
MHGPKMLTLMAVVAFAASQALIGCNTAPAPTPAAGPAPAVVVDKDGGNKVQIHPDSNGGWYSGHIIKNNDTMTWRSRNGAFHVIFNASSDPCTNPTATDGKYDYYDSTTSSSGTKPHYDAHCTIDTTNKMSPWEYDIEPRSYDPAKPYKPHLYGKRPPQTHDSVTPCGGCYLEPDDGIN